MFPKDPLRNGTWLALNSSRLVSVLNGGFEKHKHQPPYRRSRGLILLDSFDYDNFEHFVEEIDLQDIEPFTMVSVDDRAQRSIHSLIWDGAQKHLEELDVTQKMIWSSSTLYNAELRKVRTDIFKASEFSGAEDVLKMHQMSGGILGTENSFKMVRENGPETISTTQVINRKEEIEMTHLNYLTGEEIKSMYHEK